MDGIRIRVGDRFVPLENSGRYGPKKWQLTVDGCNKRTFTEIPLSEGAQEVARLNSTIWWASHPDWGRSTPITRADLDKYNLPDIYLDGFAAFPSPLPYPTGKGPEAEAARIVTEDLWMQHYAEMAALQTPILLAPKPADDSTKTGRYFSELKRGD